MSSERGIEIGIERDGKRGFEGVGKRTIDGVTAVVPCYNEEYALPETLAELKKVMEGAGIPYEIIAVNDGSTDGTKGILDKESISGADAGKFKAIHNPYNLGYSASLKKGIRAGQYGWILILDADGTYPIKDIPHLLKYRSEFDMVVGARTGNDVYVPFFRRPAKAILTKLAEFLTKKNIPDLNSGMRLFKRSVFMEFFHLFPSRFSFPTTITLACLTNDYTIKFVPIDYYRRKGKSTVRPFYDFMQFNKVIFKIVFYFEPMRFFLWPGMLLFLAGIGYGTYQALNTFPRNIGQFPFILILAGIQIIFLGFIAELVIKSRR
ncbi:glycosyltransferase family 2 protein [Candidatus Woesearchaeota archaeon]|nr:glycosyltransferase family 2 protein [Candidatus Woesearchaeota archaeon]